MSDDYKAKVTSFSLWDLLGLLLIVTLLAAVLMPVYSSNGSRGLSITQNSMRAGQFAMLAYAADFDGRFPPSYEWQDATELYGKDLRFYSAERSRQLVSPPYYFAANPKALNTQLSKASEIGSLVLLFESRSRLRNTVGGYELLRSPVDGRGRVVVGYLDGSTKLLRSPQDVYTSIKNKEW